MDKLQLKGLWNEAIGKGAITRLVFSKPGDQDVKRAEARLIQLKGGIGVQITRFSADGKAYHANFPGESAADELVGMMWDPVMKKGFHQANLFTKAGEQQIMVSQKGHWNITGKLDLDQASPIPEEALSHNRIKNRVLQEGNAIPYLVKLGISDQNGRIYDKKQDKYRQINKFLQYLQEESEYLLKGKASLRAVDFGCGKSYLTFALHDYLTRVLGLQTDFIGLDLKEDVIMTCRKTADELGLEGIRFIQGDINQFAHLEQVDLTVSLHACDTATDAALAQAVRSRSRLILSVPCCHHELAGQIQCPPMKTILEHGILKQRLAEISTDALRAKYLEACGYQTQVFEFVEAENTPKNIMLRAKWDKGPKSARARRAYEEYRELKTFLGVDPSLEHMLDGFITAEPEERTDCNRKNCFR